MEKVLAEGGWEKYVVYRVGECKIGLECCHIVCIEKTVDGRRGCQKNGESIGSACCKDYPLGFWWEAVPTVRLPVRFALYYDDREEGF